MNPYLYHFDTGTYPSDQRFEVWRDEVNAIFDVDIDQSASARFNYRLTTGYVGSLLMGCGTWSGQGEPVAYGVKRSTKMLRSDGLDHFYLCLGITHSLAGYAGRQPIHAQPSTIYLLDLASELDSEIVAGDTIILTVPRDLLPERVKSARLHGTILHGPMSSLLADHLYSLRRQLPNLSPTDMPHVEQATLAMISATLAPSVEALAQAEGEIDRAMMTRVRRFIDANLTSPDLNPLRICKEVGVSRAQLYRLFSRESGVAFYIQQRRLAAIRDLLESGKARDQRISTLAFQYGFKSESHFSRSFRQAFGCSPTEARDLGMQRDLQPAPTRRHVSSRPGSLREVLDKLDK
ncbi:AraC family transcriptional regulator [Paraburkholderia caribensis]|nr:AraC family transcriptional regulator [Paraburkholderia caribensis]